MASRNRRARNLVWLTPESFRAAERLSGLTGIPVPDLIEVVLLELTEHAAAVEHRLASATSRGGPAAARGPARVIPLADGRAAARAARPAAAPGVPDTAGTDTDGSGLGLRTGRSRRGSVRARERAFALLQGRGERD